ncbi:MAG: hypothetical protein ACTSUE_16775 [Promethearchaeota archaeon]
MEESVNTVTERSTNASTQIHKTAPSVAVMEIVFKRMFAIAILVGLEKNAAIRLGRKNSCALENGKTTHGCVTVMENVFIEMIIIIRTRGAIRTIATITDTEMVAMETVDTVEVMGMVNMEAKTAEGMEVVMVVTKNRNTEVVMEVVMVVTKNRNTEVVMEVVMVVTEEDIVITLIMEYVNVKNHGLVKNVQNLMKTYALVSHHPIMVFVLDMENVLDRITVRASIRLWEKCVNGITNQRFARDALVSLKYVQNLEKQS